MKGIAILSGLLATTVSAHMQLSTPYPIRSPLNKDAKGEKDYSYTNPLSSSGSDYPCKGYAKDDFKAVATWQPGSSQHMELEGSAVHDGGSCQLALTYDQGKTFKVIESIEGDCPIAKKYDFKIPSDAPAGDALFAWTWFNKVGNREMYMNCAMVTIGGSDSRNTNATTENHRRDEMDLANHEMEETPAEKPEHEEPADNKKPVDNKPNTKPNDHTKNVKAAASNFDSLPDLFVANVDQAGKCVTIEGEAVHFPKPGPNLVGSAKGPGYKCSGNAPFLDSKSESTNKNSTHTKNIISEKMSKIAQAFGAAAPSADSRTLNTEASTNNQFRNYVGGFRCTSGELLCSPDGYSFALCDHGHPVFMGPVAAGTICRWGAIEAAH